MSKLLQSVAIKEGMINEFDVLTVWNENQTDKPLNYFNHSWLKRNIKAEQKYLLKVTKRIRNELGSKYYSLVCDLLAKYDNLYKEISDEELDYSGQLNCSTK